MPTQGQFNDPFDVFGNDEHDSEDIEENVGGNREIARSLMQAAKFVENGKGDHTSKQVESTERLLVPETPIASADEGELVHLPWPSPLFLGPLKLLSLPEFGGGRGYVAIKRLAAGTLVMVEQPITTWPSNDPSAKLSLSSVNHIMTHGGSAIIHYIEHLHPTKESVDSEENKNQIGDMIAMLRSQYSDGDELQDTLIKAKSLNIQNSNGTEISDTDVLRLMLALRYNGLESGIYLHVAMLNHSDRPNCVKFLPSNDKPYSEVRAIHPIDVGEPLTISYIPRLLSHATRRKYLWEQHRFDIGAVPFTDQTEFELVNGEIPPSSLQVWTNETSTCRIEAAIEELDDLFQQFLEDAGSKQALEHAKALEQSILELFNESKSQLQNESHILLIPCLQLHIDCCELVQKNNNLTSKQRIRLLQRLVESARKLIVLQKRFLGADHYDIARTNLDLAQAIEELLSRSAKSLESIGDKVVKGLSNWAALAHQARQEFERVSAMYPHDVEHYINKNT